MSKLEKELYKEGYREGCLEALQRAPEDCWGEIKDLLVDRGRFSEEEATEIIEDARNRKQMRYSEEKRN